MRQWKMEYGLTTFILIKDSIQVSDYYKQAEIYDKECRFGIILEIMQKVFIM